VDLLIICVLCACLSAGCFLIAFSQQNPGFRILASIFGILFSLLALWILFQIVQILISYYRIDRDGLTICWGFQKMVVPIQQIEWIRPYDQCGYAIPMPFLERVGILSGHTFSQDLGNILFFATQQQNSILIGTAQEVLFLSPADIEAFQRGIQEAVYQGSLTPIERKSIQINSPFRAIRSSPSLYLPLLVGIFLTLVLFVYFGFLINRYDAIQVGLTLFKARSAIILPIFSAIFNLVNTIIAPKIAKKEDLKVYAYLMAYVGAFVPFFFILSIMVSML